MSKYFQVSEAPPKPEPKKEEKPPSPDAVRKQMDKFHTELMRIVEAVGRGDSPLCKAVQLTGSALLTVIARTNESPSRQNFDALMKVLQSDLNRRVRTEVQTMLDNGPYEALRRHLNG